VSKTTYTPDKAHLVSHSYANDGPLSVRIETHRLYSVPPIDLPAWVLEHYAWRGDETVLDVGTGTGQYLVPLQARLPHGRLIAGDLAGGMLRDLRAKGNASGAALLNADAEALPLADASCEVVLASYVLFFVSDISRALAEARRILRPGGALLAVTMAAVYMEELRAAMSQALRVLGFAPASSWNTLHKRFNLDNGLAYLAPHFHVVQHRHEAALVFPAAEPVLAYVNSMRASLQQDLPSEQAWDEFVSTLRRIVEQAIAARGNFTVSKASGVLIATKPA